MASRRSLLWLPGVFGLSLLAGCTTGPSGPVTLKLTVRAGTDQNPDPMGHAAPVAIRVLQLAATGRFDRADVYALLAHETEILGADLLGSEEFVVAPGTVRTLTRTLAPGTRFVGIAVLFRDIDHSDWRLSAPVASSGMTDLTLSISGLKATLSGA